LEQNRGDGIILRHESPIIKAIARLHESVELPLGDIAIMPSKSAINALAKAAYSNDIEALNNNIRLCCQYEVTDGGRVIHLAGDKREQIKHYLVEDTLSFLSLSYPTEENYRGVGADGPALRKNGMPALVHILQVMGGVAAIEAPLNEDDRLSFAPVVEGGTHDLIEDIRDESLSMRNMKFRVRRERGGIETLNEQAMLDHLVKLYTEYNEYVAKRIVKGQLRLTRKEPPKGMTKEEYYIFTYLRDVYMDNFCAKAKAEDFHSNSMSIRNVLDEIEMIRLARGLIYKGLPQVLAWKKDAWVEYHRLLARLEDILSLFKNEPEYRGIVDEIMAPSAVDLENFANGFVLAGSRKFNYRLMATMPPSGSPVLTHYQTVRKGKLISEIEIPFCRNRYQAADIIQSGFHDVLCEDIMQAPNIIQKRLGSGAVYMFDAKEKWNVHNRMRTCRRKYDSMLHDGYMGSAFIGFDRNRSAQEAGRKWGPQINSGSKRLERFKFYKVQVH